MNKYEQALQAVRDIYVTYPKKIELNEQELSKLDQETQDLLHALELGKFSASQGYQLAKELQRVRQERRQVKDDLELLVPIKEFVSFAKPTEKNIGHILGKVRKVQHNHELRKYTMRVRADLQGMVK